MATAHTCPHDLSPRCIGGLQPGKGPRKCPGCGAKPVRHIGSWAVFRWRGDGAYRSADIIRRCATRGAAERYADANGDHLVVRWITEDIAA